MDSTTRTRAATAAALVAALAAAVPAVAGAAGRTEVSWLEPQNFRDAGYGSWERERTMRDIGAFMQKLGERLPDGQVLTIAVTDVDLAGTVFPQDAREFRILRGGADWPAMSMRYTLTAADGRVLKSGTADLRDMAYRFTPRPASAITEGDFPYEKRMIHRWFNEEILDNRAQARSTR